MIGLVIDAVILLGVYLYAKTLGLKEGFRRGAISGGLDPAYVDELIEEKKYLNSDPSSIPAAVSQLNNDAADDPEGVNTPDPSPDEPPSI